jgi:hypothetical protein
MTFLDSFLPLIFNEMYLICPLEFIVPVLTDVFTLQYTYYLIFGEYIIEMYHIYFTCSLNILKVYIVNAPP